VTRVLAGDLGGTHVRLAIVDDAAGSWRIVTEHTTASRDYPALLPAVQQFLVGVDVPARMCIGVPGPVRSGRAELSNLAWTVDAMELAKATGIETTIINDFVAVGYAIPELTPTDVVEIQPGDGNHADEPIAVIGPGTGLGQVFLLNEHGRYRPYPSEGGHVDFAPTNPMEYQLHAYLSQSYEHVSVERVVSGPGLVHTYQFLLARAGRTEHHEITDAPERGKAAAISRLALNHEDSICAEALAVFVRALASQAADFTLTIQATGGVYIAGGIAPQILPALLDGSFAETFRAKGRMRNLLETVPVHVVVAEDIGLLGAAAAAAGAGADR